MLRTLSLILLLALPLFSVFSQRTPFRYMAGSSAEAEEQFVQEGAIYEATLAIYKKLIEARGDQRFNPPSLLISQAVGDIAFLAEDGKSIAIEEKAFNYCKSLQGEQFENALAALLAHELTHFYEKHLWSSSFAAEYRDLAVGVNINKVQDRIIYETQADYLGGFLAYSAGYDVFEYLPQFIDDIYKAYWPNKEPKMEGYPSLEDRMELAKRSVKKVKEFVQVFEMANLMTAIGRYDDARAFYRHILAEYQSPTIYNNLGIVTVLEATEHFTKADKQVYRMPLELDLRFKIGGRGFGGQTKWEQLLEEAIRYFDFAIGMNADYAPAYLNKACAYFLRKDYPKAKFYATVEAMGRANNAQQLYPKTAVDADILAALITYEENANATTKQAALAALDAILQKDPSNLIADYNRKVLAGDPLPTPDPKQGKSISVNDMDGASGLDLFVENAEFEGPNPDLDLKLSGEFTFRKWGSETSGHKNSTIYYAKPPFGATSKTRIYLQISNTGADLPLRGRFKPGETTKADILGYPIMKVPKSVRSLPNGEVLVYNSLLLFFDEAGVLQRWGRYFTK